jgi:hypothetical protein
MSSQSYLFNPTERTLAAAGDGFSAPRLTTTDRLALTLGVNGKGMMVYDTTLTTLCLWNGTAWEFIGDNSNGWVSVKDFGAKGDGVTNDAPAIQTALDYIVSTGNQGILLFPAGTYKCNAGLTVKCAFTGCLGERAVLDFSSLGDVPAITFTGGGRYASGNPWNQATFSFDGFVLNGPSAVSGTGFYLNDLTVGVNGGPSHTTFRNFQITNFRTGIYFGNRAYLNSFDHFDIWNVTYGIWYPINDLAGNPLSDSGEMIAFYNGAIFGCSQYDFYCESTVVNSDFSFNSCSFDGNGDAQIYNNSGVIGLNSCHFEGSAKRAIVNATSNGFITINGGYLIDGGDTSLVGYIQNKGFMSIYGGRIASFGRAGVVFSDTRLVLFGTHLQTDQTIANQIIATGNYNYWIPNVGTQQISSDVVFANGAGVNFSATPDSPGATGEVLKDYEEGTWTPSLTFATPGTLAVTYNARVGLYTKVGRVVTVECRIVIPIGGFVKGTASGQFSITGIPFTPTAAAGFYVDLAASLADISSGSFVTLNATGVSWPFESNSVVGVRVQRDYAGVTAANFAVTNAGFIQLTFKITYQT